MKKRIQKKKEAKIIQKYEPGLMNVLNPILQIVENFDPLEYRTEEARIQKVLNENFQYTGVREAFTEIFPNLNLNLHFQKMRKEVKREIQEKCIQDFRFATLLQVVEDAEKMYPNIATLIIFKRNFFDTLAKGFEPYDLMHEYEAQQGERRARAAVRFFREVAEMVYSNYLKILIEFVEILECKSVIKSFQRFGVLANQLPDRLEKLGYKNLVDKDAGWLRNAACHSHWKYISDSDTILLWDTNHEKIEMTSERLFSKGLDMYVMCIEQFQSLILLYLKNKICTDWSDIIMYLQINFYKLLNDDLQVKNNLESKLEQYFSSLSHLEFKEAK